MQCNRPSGTARSSYEPQAAVMISLVAPPLHTDNNCCQSSCHFDESLFQDDTAGRLGLVLPTHLIGAVQKRKAEFVAGRFCARAALAQLDCNFAVTPGDLTDGAATTRDVPIGIGENREPVWPPGFVGSITHTHGYASAIVARSSKIRSIGLDSEMWIEPASADYVSQQILTPGESYTDHLHLFSSPLHYLTFVFSAKESLFKCLFPLVRRFFDFHAAIITPLPSESATNGRFRFELQEDLNGEFRAGFSGDGIYSVDNAGVHTAVILKV